MTVQYEMVEIRVELKIRDSVVLDMCCATKYNNNIKKTQINVPNEYLLRKRTARKTFNPKYFISLPLSVSEAQELPEISQYE